MSLRSAARRSPWISGGCGSSPGRARAVGLSLTALGFALGRYLALVLPRSPLLLLCSPLFREARVKLWFFNIYYAVLLK